MTFIKSLSTCISSIALLLPIASQAQIEVKEITTRPSVTVKFVYAKAVNPVASAILFPDGYQSNAIFSNGDVRLSNFLNADVAKFVQNGISVLFTDAPSDQSSWNKFRNTPEHAQDNAALMAFLKLQADVPIWAIGHGNGALSAASLGSFNSQLAGIVLASPNQKAPFGVSASHPVFLAPLDQIKQPVLVLQHKEDTCLVSKHEGVQSVLDAIKSSKKKALLTIDGGTSANNSCYRGFHGYQGLEEIVIKQMADWIKATQAEMKPQ